VCILLVQLQYNMYYLVVDREVNDYVFHRYNIITLGYFLLPRTPDSGGVAITLKYGFHLISQNILSRWRHELRWKRTIWGPLLELFE